MKSDVFKLYSQYYNLFYADKSYDSEVEYIDRLIKEFSPQAKSILEYGSGTGGHGLLLKEKGYHLLGIERSEDMARIALAKGYACQVGDVLDVEISDQYDACIALFHVVSYINSNQDLLRLFRKTKSALKKDGLFIFDVWFSPAVMHQVPAVRVKKVEHEEIQVTRVAQPTIDHLNNIVDVNYQVFIKNKRTNEFAELSESHRMRHFGVPEIQFLADQTGFVILKAEEFLTRNQPSSSTWGVNFILQAKS